eukprot:12771010-Alexandrium_andersonii.AAC.1
MSFMPLARLWILGVSTTLGGAGACDWIVARVQEPEHMRAATHQICTPMQVPMHAVARACPRGPFSTCASRMFAVLGSVA